MLLTKEFIDFSKKFKYDYSASEYKNTIEEFEQFIYPIKITDSTKNDVESFFLHLASSVNLSTIEKKTSHLSSFFKYLLTNEVIESNPMKKIKRKQIKRDVSPKKVLTKKDIDTVFKNLHILDPTKRLVVFLFITTGINVGEAHNMRFRDLIKDEQNRLYLAIDSNKKRILKMHSQLEEVLIEHINYQGIKINEINKDGYIMFKQKDMFNRYCQRSLKRIVKDYLLDIGISEKTARDLRHTFISYALLNGASKLETIKHIGIKEELSLRRYNKIVSYSDSELIDLLESKNVFPVELI